MSLYPAGEQKLQKERKMTHHRNSKFREKAALQKAAQLSYNPKWEQGKLHLAGCKDQTNSNHFA
jgi:hypothetical protein